MGDLGDTMSPPPRTHFQMKQEALLSNFDLNVIVLPVGEIQVVCYSNEMMILSLKGFSLCNLSLNPIAVILLLFFSELLHYHLHMFSEDN